MQLRAPNQWGGGARGPSIKLITQLVLVMAFSSSFFVYFLDYTQTQLAMPIALLWVLAFGLVIRGISRRGILGRIDLPFSVPLSILLYAVSIPAVASLFTKESSPALYAAALIATLISVRIILGAVSIGDVMKAFFYSGLITTGGFIVADYGAFSDAVSGQQRLSILSFHPNLIGFIFGGFLSVSVFVILQRHRWLVPLAYSLILISAVIVFLASSRGSLVAVIIAATSFLILALWRRPTWGKLLEIAGWFFVITGFLAVLGALIWAVTPRSVEVAFDYVNRILQLTNKYRGLDTGLTGRLHNWDVTVAAIEGWRWFVGYGFRTSAGELGFSVDNGYLTLIYETGIVATAVIVGGYFRAVWHLIRCYREGGSAEKNAMALGGVVFLSFFLTNNIVARYLFGIGNPVSLLALFFLVLHAKELRLRNRTLRDAEHGLAEGFV